ncbi:SDR family NAD(P)-dependent oxidoreductase [Mucilaginibacter antarcticus]
MHQTGKPRYGNLKSPEGYSAVKAYSDSKLFNIYFTKSLAERFADSGVTAYALHPGVVKTQFNAKLSGFLKFFFSLSAPFAITPEKGADTSVYLATAPKLAIKSGSYYIKRKAKATAAIVNDLDARNKLWALSEEFVAPFKV